MIVRPGDGVLHLVTQPDHAALAARVMAMWPALAGAPRRTEILIAIEHHDRGWSETDAAPTVDPATGRIRDFIRAPIAIRQGVWPVSVRLLADTPWAAALVAHHAVTVYGRFRGDDAWQTFFPQMTALRDEHVERAGGDLTLLEADYVDVRLGDLLSLAFCTGASQPERLGPWTIRLEGTRLHVTPNPFDAEVPFAVAAREIPDVLYPDDAALQEAIAAGVPRLLAGVVAFEPAG
jgi:hypothetical protein